MGLPSIPNVYLYAAAAVAIAVAVWWVDNNGYQRALSDQAVAERKQLEKDSKAVDEIRKEEKVREKIVIKWKTKIQKIDGCHGNTPLPGDNAVKLYNAYDELKRSATP